MMNNPQGFQPSISIPPTPKKVSIIRKENYASVSSLLNTTYKVKRQWIRTFKAPKESKCEQRIRHPLEIVHCYLGNAKQF